MKRMKENKNRRNPLLHEFIQFNSIIIQGPLPDAFQNICKNEKINKYKIPE